MIGKVVVRLQSIDPTKLSARDCAQWVEVATKIDRLALGSPTDVVDHQAGGAPLDPSLLSPEERRIRLEQLIAEGGRRLRSVGNA